MGHNAGSSQTQPRLLSSSHHIKAQAAVPALCSLKPSGPCSFLPETDASSLKLPDEARLHRMSSTAALEVTLNSMHASTLALRTASGTHKLL